MYLQKKIDIAYEEITGVIRATTPDKNITSAVIWNDKADLITAQVINANPDQIAYTSFEEGPGLEGQWTMTSSNPVDNWQSGNVHTGSVSLYSPVVDIEMEKKDLPAGKYKVSFWIHPNGQSNLSPIVKSSESNLATVNQTLSRASGWKLYEAVITLTTDTKIQLVIPNGVYLDEVRLHPAQARMTTFNHRPLVGLISKTGVNHHTEYYEYDGLKRLRIVKDFDGNIIKRHTYKYKKNH